MRKLAERFEDLEIWQDARVLNREIYISMEACRDFSFRDQIRRASISVMNNIAEGFERNTDKDFAHFLDVAKGSCGEIRSMAYAAQDIGVLKEPVARELQSKAEMLSKRIAALTRHLRK